MRERPSIKLLHTADFHFGDGYWEERLAHDALTAVVDIAIAEQVDALLIAGDLFDRNSASPEDIRFVLRELNRLPCLVVLLPGNHDALDSQSVYRKDDFIKTCPNLKLLADADGQMLIFPELCLAVWGRPVIEHNSKFNPLAGIPAPKNGYWHVAIAHGLCPLDGWDPDRSSLIRIGEISSSGWHYLALGHVHAFRDVSEGGLVACYPGTPVNANHIVNGAGSVAIVEMKDDLGVSIRRAYLKTIPT